MEIHWFFLYTKYGFYVKKLVFHQPVWHSNIQKLHWFCCDYVNPNIGSGVFVLRGREKMGEKSHNVTADVDCPFSNGVNTKPPSIKLKKKNNCPKRKITHVEIDQLIWSAVSWSCFQTAQDFWAECGHLFLQAKICSENYFHWKLRPCRNQSTDLVSRWYKLLVKNSFEQYLSVIFINSSRF